MARLYDKNFNNPLEKIGENPENNDNGNDSSSPDMLQKPRQMFSLPIHGFRK